MQLFGTNIRSSESASASIQEQIQFLVDAPGISFEDIENGLHHCNLDFLIAAISPDAKTIASDGHTVDARLKPDQIRQSESEWLAFFHAASACARKLFPAPGRPRQPHRLARHPHRSPLDRGSLNSSWRSAMSEYE
jgi:hypothetical protein